MFNTIIIVAYPPRFLYELFNIKVDEIIIILSLYLPCKRNNHSLISYYFSICSHGGRKKTCLTWTWSGEDGCARRCICFQWFTVQINLNQPHASCLLSLSLLLVEGRRYTEHGLGEEAMEADQVDCRPSPSPFTSAYLVYFSNQYDVMWEAILLC